MTEIPLTQRITMRAIIGPLSVFLCVGLLVFCQSPLLFELAAVSLLGMMFCWKWERKGLAISIGFLAGILAYDWIVHKEQFSFWILGLSFSLALSFLITTLSREEINEIHEETRSEAFKEYQGVLSDKNQREESLRTLLEKTRSELLETQKKNQELELSLSEERQKIADFNAQLAFLPEIETLKKSDIFETLSTLNRDLIGAKAALESVSSRLSNTQKQQSEENAQFQLLLEQQLSLVKQLEGEKKHLKEELEAFNQMHLEKQLQEGEIKIQLQTAIEEQKERIDRLVAEKNNLETSLFSAKQNATETESHLVSLNEQIQGLQSTIFAFQDEIISKDASLKKLADTESTLLKKKAELDELGKMVAQISNEKSEMELRVSSLELELERLVDSTQSKQISESDIQNSKPYARLQGMHRQLREQFTEKSLLLDHTRRELFLTQEEKFKKENEFYEEIQFDSQETLKKFEEQMIVLNQLIEQKEEEISSLQHLISHILVQP